MTSMILAASLLAGLACASVLTPREVEVVYGARSPAALVPLSPRAVEVRSDHNKTFDIGWQIQDEPLFSANWTGGTGYIPVGPPAVQASATEAFSLSVECNDCRTFGNILADFNDDEGLSLSLTFNKVGVHMDFGVFSSHQGTYTIGLGRFFGKKAAGDNVKGLFSATIGIGIDLVLGFTGDVKATGGFQIGIPDQERIGLGIDLPDIDDILAGNLNVSAGLDLVPNVNFALLPIHLSHTSANITAAIVLRAEAGLTLNKSPITQNTNFGATVSASLTLAEVTFGEVSSDGTNGSCKQALFIDIDSAAAAQALVGGSIAGHEFEHGPPDVSTVFLSAGTTTCLDDNTSSTTTTSPTPSSPPLACPTASQITETKNLTKTFSVTSCLVPAIACPPSLSQVVLVTSVSPLTATRCPSSSNATTPPPTTVSAPPLYTAGVLVLPPLTSPVVTSLPASLLANVTAPVNATVVGVAVTVPPFTTPPPPPPPPEATDAVNVGGNNDTLPVTSSSAASGMAGQARGGSWVGMVGVLAGAVVLI